MSSSLQAPEQAAEPPADPARRSRRRSPFLLVAAAVAVATIVPTSLLFRRATDPGTGDPPERGDTAPAFAGRTESGDVVSLERLSGQPVVLHFCGSWNPLCDEDLEVLAAALVDHRADRPGSDLAVVDVLVDDDLGRAKDFYRERGADWLVIADPDAVIARAYGVVGVPQTFFVDRRGRIAARNFGALAPTTLAGRIDDLT